MSSSDSRHESMRSRDSWLSNLRRRGFKGVCETGKRLRSRQPGETRETVVVATAVMVSALATREIYKVVFMVVVALRVAVACMWGILCCTTVHKRASHVTLCMFVGFVDTSYHDKCIVQLQFKYGGGAWVSARHRCWLYEHINKPSFIHGEPATKATITIFTCTFCGRHLQPDSNTEESISNDQSASNIWLIFHHSPFARTMPESKISLLTTKLFIISRVHYFHASTHQ